MNDGGRTHNADAISVPRNAIWDLGVSVVVVQGKGSDKRHSGEDRHAPSAIARPRKTTDSVIPTSTYGIRRPALPTSSYRW